MGFAMISVVSAGIAPGLALLSYFYLKDEYEKEPVLQVLKTFILGAALVFPIMFIQYVLDYEQVFPARVLRAFIVAGFLEEFFKWFFLYYTVFKFRLLDEPYDGIVYGVSISLGFATVENILFLMANGIQYALGRAVLPVSSHALFGVIMGYYLGKSEFAGRGKPVYLALSVVLPILFHGLYDLILTFFHWYVWMLPFMLCLWFLAMWKVKRAKAAKFSYGSSKKSFTG
ncbi:hypothetical protein B4135_2004 [Caldibacillus debilis]|uniref:Protease PrsW n=2 Tax=Caldibacillus debilis TaxID=301148 RepID=A0A150M6S1_9BACI|nr:hypothetical protein B4135_2004 [Caldibacillus debilis]